MSYYNVHDHLPKPTNDFQQTAAYNSSSSEKGLCESVLECNPLPDACTNDIREANLIERQQKFQYGRSDNATRFQRFCERERNLIIACVILIVAMNVTTGRYLLYPFKIFSTWVHEMCHGLAAILMGGYISKLQIFKDGSGLAYTAVSGDWKRGFVASGGYPGTAVTGCILLLFRRTTLGPTIGTIGIGACMVLSCVFWVRNTWGLGVLLLEGWVLIVLGWQLPAVILDNLFNFLAATCCLNAVESIQDLFADGDMYVGGEVTTTSDAHTVAEKWGMTYRFWAILWLWMSFALTGVGIICAFNARTISCFKGGGTSATVPTNYTTNNNDNNEIIDAQVTPANGQYYAAQPYNTRSIPHAVPVAAQPGTSQQQQQQKKKKKWTNKFWDDW